MFDLNQLLGMGPVQPVDLTPGFRAPQGPGMGDAAGASGGQQGASGFNMMDPLGLLGGILPSFNGRQMGQIRTGGGFGQTASDIFDTLQPPGTPGINPIGLFDFFKDPSGGSFLNMIRPGLIPGLF
jgi:hypothetical protein